MIKYYYVLKGSQINKVLCPLCKMSQQRLLRHVTVDV